MFTHENTNQIQQELTVSGGKFVHQPSSDLKGCIIWTKVFDCPLPWYIHSFKGFPQDSLVFWGTFLSIL